MANYVLAGMVGQDRGSGGGWPFGALGIRDVEVAAWDADLPVRSGFRRYMMDYTNGFTIDWFLGGREVRPARPVLTSSDRNWHAFVITGANNTRLWVHDSNAMWAGTAPSQTWEEFRAVNCTLLDPMDREGGCSEDTAPEVWTAVLPRGLARPANQRMGTLDPQAPGGDSQMIVFRRPDGQAVARLVWDGRRGDSGLLGPFDPGTRQVPGGPWIAGYYVRDEADFRQLPDGRIEHGINNVLADDDTFGNLVPWSARVDVAVDVVNVTDVVGTYQVEAAFEGPRGAVTLRDEVEVAAFSRGPVSLTVPLESIVGQVAARTLFRLTLRLTREGVVQDEKFYEFAAGSAVRPRILSLTPDQGAAVPLGQPVRFEAVVTDDDEPAGRPCCTITWDPEPNFTGIVTGPNVAYLFENPGEQRVRVTATDSVGLTTTLERTIDVINTPPVPTINAQPRPIYPRQRAALTGSARDVNEPDGILPCAALTWSALEAGDVVAGDGCTGLFTFAAEGNRRVRLTAQDPQRASAAVDLVVVVEPTPANLPPAPRILSPAANTVINWDSQVRLAGDAIDPELDVPYSFVWTATSYRPDGRTVFASAEIGRTPVIDLWVPLNARLHDFATCQGPGQRLVLTLRVADRLGNAAEVSLDLVYFCPPG